MMSVRSVILRYEVILRSKRVKEVVTSLKEVKSSGASMKKRIEELTANDGQQRKCDCHHDNERFEKEIATLKSQYHGLESIVREKGQLQMKLTDDTDQLKARLDNMELLLQKRIDMYLSVSDDHGNNTIKEIDSQRETVVNNSEKEQKTQTQTHSVATVKQEVSRVYDSEMHWRSMANMVRRRNHGLYKNLGDIHVVVCVDISESMTESNGWTKAHTFLSDYLTGLDDVSKFHDFTPEHISVVVYGHETKVLVEYTDRYKDILSKIDTIKLGGPTQMFGGVLLADAMAFCNKLHVEHCNNGARILTKIIIITDGKTTEAGLIAGPDKVYVNKVDETKAMILQEMEGFRRTLRDVFFVPVGNLDLDFINIMAACSDGMILDYTHGKRFSKRQLLSKQLIDPFRLMTDSFTTFTTGSDHTLSTEDKEDMRSIQERGSRVLEERAKIIDGKNKYEENQSTQLPTVGSRVRLSPDWGYDNQESQGLRTVIGHENDDQVWCEWDINGYKNVYNYESEQYTKCSVLVVDEPRKLKAGDIIAVGCQVIPGKDWNNSDVSVDTGVAIKHDKKNNSVLVRWNNGKRGTYSYAGDGKQEVIVKPVGDKEVGIGQRGMQSINATSSEWNIPPAMSIKEFETKKTKNKNKNINKNISK